LHGIKFIAPEVSSKELLMASQVAATITGTIAWEAALNHKPAMYFGYPWYQGCPGTTKVSSAIEVSAVLNDLESATATQLAINAFLHALADATFPYAQNAWVLSPPPASDTEQFNGMIEALTWWHINRYMAQESEPIMDDRPRRSTWRTL
ncbi:MAG: hypothetical protein PF636_09445, partial [Actinomycetota bacterium]|nr:hypothetical protein [Actinomycetota bacterium]